MLAQQPFRRAENLAEQEAALAPRAFRQMGYLAEQSYAIFLERGCLQKQQMPCCSRRKARI